MKNGAFKNSFLFLFSDILVKGRMCWKVEPNVDVYILVIGVIEHHYALYNSFLYVFQ